MSADGVRPLGTGNPVKRGDRIGIELTGTGGRVFGTVDHVNPDGTFTITTTLCAEHGLPVGMWHAPLGCHPDALEHEPRPSITCPQCARTSWNPNDVRERYCGACHQYHDQMDLPT